MFGQTGSRYIAARGGAPLAVVVLLDGQKRRSQRPLFVLCQPRCGAGATAEPEIRPLHRGTSINVFILRGVAPVLPLFGQKFVNHLRRVNAYEPACCRTRILREMFLAGSPGAAVNPPHARTAGSPHLQEYSPRDQRAANPRPLDLPTHLRGGSSPSVRHVPLSDGLVAVSARGVRRERDVSAN
jgi:hypothetical protein